MASVTYGRYVFGLNDLKVTNIGGTVQEDLDAAMELEFMIMFKEGMVEGDDSIKSVFAFAIGGEGKVTAGAISSAALAILTGRTLATSGTTPNEITTLTLSAGDRMPYFKLYGAALDDETGDLQIQIFKCKLKGGLTINLKNGEFTTPGFEIIAIDDNTNGIADYVQNETATALPSS